jgi:hypothetical protein
VIMPRRGSERLDNVVEFGVAELSKHIQPVKNACQSSQPNVQPTPIVEPKKI